MKSKGFTLIELMIVIAIIGIVISIALNLASPEVASRSGANKSSSSSGTVVSRTEMKCVNGLLFKFENGTATEAKDSAGKGVKC